MDNLYGILGVEKTATKAELKKTYRNLCKKHHPDKGEGSNEKKFIKISKAYNILINEESRKHYDETGQIPGVPLEEELMNMARSELSQLFQNVVFGIINSTDISTIDVIDVFRKNINTAVITENETIAKLALYIKQLTTFKARLVCKSEEHILQDILEHHFSNLYNEERNITKRLEMLKLMLELLSDYSYNTGLVVV